VSGASNSVFESSISLPDTHIDRRASALLGFDTRYARVSKQLELMLKSSELDAWSEKHHNRKLKVVELLGDQYPLAIFHGDVGTGKTASAEAIANRLARESGIEDCLLYKLSNRVRGTGKVGEMGSLISSAFAEITSGLGKRRRAFLVIDEGDSLGASRSQEHSHHEDKVGVNTLIQAIDDLRKHGGRVFTILCTNRLGALDAAVLRRASIIEEFERPTDEERRELFFQDLGDLKPTATELASLVKATAASDDQPRWTYSDIRTRLYPAAVSVAFPQEPLKISHFITALKNLKPSPVMPG